jgi:hypothetical protein
MLYNIIVWWRAKPDTRCYHGDSSTVVVGAESTARSAAPSNKSICIQSNPMYELACINALSPGRGLHPLFFMCSSILSRQPRTIEWVCSSAVEMESSSMQWSWKAISREEREVLLVLLALDDWHCLYTPRPRPRHSPPPNYTTLNFPHLSHRHSHHLVHPKSPTFWQYTNPSRGGIAYWNPL